MTRNDIASVQMTLVDYDKVKAYATVNLACGISIKGIRMITGRNGVFPAMPSRKTKKNGEDAWEDSVLIQDEDDRKLFQQIIFDKYNALTESGERSTEKKEAVKDTPTESFSKSKTSDIDYLC